MKALISIPVLALLCGCSSTGQLSPAVTADINAVYNNVCTALPALGPITGMMDGKAQNAYGQFSLICATGSPTNAIAAGVDLLALEQALVPYFGKASATTPKQARALKALRA